ncbi:fimbrial protein [Serratia marcescens]|uniref:fimbrial protein n=1 Tax=Serratia marcescens TaxID=615 RepID=UPI0013DBFA63|nr:fimbrial protein [Serratia marcescens]
MFSKITLLTLLMLFSGSSNATCYGNGIQYAPPIYVDLSDKLSDKTPVWEGSFYTQYSGSFNCKTRHNTFGYTAVLSTKDSSATILGFNDGKYWVRAEIINDIPNKEIPNRGQYSASILNVPMNIRFSLVKKSGVIVPGDTVQLNDVMFVTDLTGLTLMQILAWPVKQVVKILTWLVNGFNWPYDQRDMFGQPMTIKYAPRRTTCSFDNAGLSVKLPTMGVSQIIQGAKNGLTPFTLNFSCKNRYNDGTSGQQIDMFLSSNNLLPSDNTLLIDKSTTGAKGVGIRLINMDTPNSPVSLSYSNLERGMATSLFHVIKGGKLNDQLSIRMGAFYYPYDTQSISSGEINTSATLNIIYK